MMARAVHPIEKQSYEVLRARADTAALPPWTRAVVERVIHASADLGYLDDLVCAEADLAAAAAQRLGGRLGDDGRRDHRPRGGLPDR